MPEPSLPGDASLVGAALRGAKDALRRRTLGLRDALPADARAEKGAAIAARIACLPSFRAARVLLLTIAFRTEWDTAPLVQAVLGTGRTVVLPRVDTRTRMLELHEITDVARDVAAGHQGIPEPHADCRTLLPSQIDWVLVPGVAFDAAGRRLGYGGGYYDRLLPLLPPEATRVAGAFDLQVVDTVPAAPHDLRVDVVVTESQLLACAR